MRHKCRIFSDMDLRTQLIATADLYGAATKRSRARVSTLVFNQGQRLAKIADGALDPTISSFERAMAWFAKNWPNDAPWPDGVPQPILMQPSASTPQLGNGCVEGGAGEVAAGHDASLADGTPAVTANGAGSFA